MPWRWVALTGTPGAGKTTVARSLRRSGFEVVDANRFARSSGAIEGVDLERRSQIVDVRRVGRGLRRRFPDRGPLRVLEGHWSHAVPGMDAAIVLRLNPNVLRRRLAARGWAKAKVQENAEAEALGIVLQEARATFPSGHVAEYDMTRRSEPRAARRIAALLRDPRHRLTNFEIGRVDWTEELLRWF